MSLPNLPEPLVRAIAELRTKEQENAADIRELRAYLAQLVDILRHRGELAKGHERLLEKIAQRARAPRKTAVTLSTITDKHSAASPDIDCASLLHLCQARCCSFKVSLAETDVRAGTLDWDIQDPYVLARGSDGYCAYIDRASGGCTCYEERPGICRTYDCRQDTRVWLDFEKRVPAPLSLPPIFRTDTPEDG